MTALDADAILSRVRKVAAATFGCKESMIGPRTTALDVNGWDSLSHTLFILAIEREFAVRFDLARVVGFDNVGDLVQELSRLGP